MVQHAVDEPRLLAFREEGAGNLDKFVDHHLRRRVALGQLGPGGAVSIPAGARHAFRNVGSHEARLLVTVTPGGLDEFFREVDRRGLGPGDMAAVVEIAARHNLEFVGPPID